MKELRLAIPFIPAGKILSRSLSLAPEVSERYRWEVRWILVGGTGFEPVTPAV